MRSTRPPFGKGIETIEGIITMGSPSHPRARGDASLCGSGAEATVECTDIDMPARAVGDEWQATEAASDNTMAFYARE